MAEAGRAARSHAVCVYRNSGVNNQGVFWDPPMHSTMVTDGRFKLIHYTSGGAAEREVFDLHNDPHECHNLSGQAACKDREFDLLVHLVDFLAAEAGKLQPRANPSIPDPSQMLSNRLK